MRRLSEFYGLAICMYFADHNPPHFHAIYADHEALIRINDGGTIRGDSPRPQRAWSSSGEHFTTTNSLRTGCWPKSQQPSTPCRGSSRSSSVRP
ncbi:MAG: DUF4160 domain-containing protein [Rhodococcus sp. (in: high G+C Gram-positive bacteria)]